MILEEGIRATLLADAGVSALTGTRVYPRKAPQTPGLPLITMTRVATGRGHDMQGSDGLPNGTIQLACWAVTPLEASSVATAVKGRLEGRAWETWGDVLVESSLCVGERDLDDPDTGRAGVGLDFAIQYQET